MKKSASRSSVHGVGLGLRRAFMDELEARWPDGIDWLEVSPENYIARGGRLRRGLDRAREHYPIVTHGLTLSLGGVDPLDTNYLREVRALVEQLGSPWHSDHLCFSSIDGDVLHDLLPVPFTPAVAASIADRLMRTRDTIRVPVAVENISYYARPGTDSMDEASFIGEILERADGLLLLDVNNVYVNARNHGFDPRAFIASLPLERVVQIHVAGHFDPGDGLVIDTHGEPVCDPVLALLDFTLRLTGPVPVLLERDNAVPALDELLNELAVIRTVYEEAMRGGHHVGSEPAAISA